MIVYVTVCEDNRADPVVRVHEHPESGRLTIREWAKDSIDNGDPIDYEDYDGEDDGIVLIVTIGEGTAYEGRYQAAMYRCEAEFTITRPALSSEQR